MKRDGDMVSGYWIQDKIGTLEQAKQYAIETNAVNGNGLDIAVVEQLNNTTPILDYFTNLKKLK